jgi:hypothetical protein
MGAFGDTLGAVKFLLWFLLAIRCGCAYVDDELLELWASIPNIYEPTLRDWRLIESYLKHGERPYLQNLLEASWTNIGDEVNLRVNIMRDFMLVGPNGEMPVFEVHHLNVTPKTADRCILVYGSYNSPYPQKVRHVLDELKEHGYSGTVMIRIGGYPNLSHGGLKSSPFHGRWKLEFFKEARRMGYTKILHLDSHVHPMCNLNPVFDILDENGGYFYGFGPWLDVNENFEEFGPYLGVPPNQIANIHFISGCSLGLNFTDKRVIKLFDDWDDRMQQVDRFYCIGLEEITFMALSWKYGVKPIPPAFVVGDFAPDMGLAENYWIMFFYDLHRVQTRQGLAPLDD